MLWAHCQYLSLARSLAVSLMGPYCTSRQLSYKQLALGPEFTCYCVRAA